MWVNVENILFWRIISQEELPGCWFRVLVCSLSCACIAPGCSSELRATLLVLPPSHPPTNHPPPSIFSLARLSVCLLAVCSQAAARIHVFGWEVKSDTENISYVSTNSFFFLLRAYSFDNVLREKGLMLWISGWNLNSKFWRISMIWSR